MNKRIKEIWVNALESKLYKGKQCKGKLKSSNGKFCVLGILCNELGPELWKKETDGWNKDIYYHNNRSAYPSDEILSMSNLSLDIVDKLSEMNDKGQSFKQLASWIRKHL